MTIALSGNDLTFQQLYDAALRGESVSLWVVPSSEIIASDPREKDELFEPTGSKIYRHPTFYEVPDEVGHM